MASPLPTRSLRLLLLSTAVASLAAGLPGRAAESVEGRKLFVKNCAPCHSEDGRARTPAARKLGVKDLTLSKLNDDQIRLQIQQGVQEKNGQAKMPSFKDKFSDAEIRALIRVVKAFRP